AVTTSDYISFSLRCGTASSTAANTLEARPMFGRRSRIDPGVTSSRYWQRASRPEEGRTAHARGPRRNQGIRGGFWEQYSDTVAAKGAGVSLDDHPAPVTPSLVLEAVRLNKGLNLAAVESSRRRRAGKWFRRGQQQVVEATGRSATLSEV